MRVRWSGIVGVAITVLLLWWALHNVDFVDAWAGLRTARAGWMLAAVVVATLTFPLRTIRWRSLLHERGAPPPFRALWHATAIGFMANNLLPARAGEVARALAVTRMATVRFTTAFGSIAVERVFDGLTIAALFVLGVSLGGFPADAEVAGVAVRHVAAAGAAIFGAAMIAAILIVVAPALWLRLAERAFQRVLPVAWSARAVAMLEGLIAGLSALRAPGRLAAVLWWSVVLWLVNAASFTLAFGAFGLAVPPGTSLVLTGVLAFGVAVPSTPGFVGVFEAAFVATLTLYGVSETQGVTTALAYHVAGFIPITLLGLWSLRKAELRLGDLRSGRTAAGAARAGN